MNFDYLKTIPQMNDLYLACCDSERFVLSEPSISVAAARRAVEYLVKLIYSSAVTPYIEGMSIYDMLNDAAFTNYIDDETVIERIHAIRKAGNRAVHEGKISDKEAMDILKDLHFVVGELCIFLKLIPSYPEFRTISQKTMDQSMPMSPVELEISQAFVAQLHKQISERQSGLNDKKLINIHIDPRKTDVNSKIDTGANTRVAFGCAISFLTDNLPDCVVLPDRVKCLITLKSNSEKSITIAIKSGCPQLSTVVDGEIQLLPNIDFVLYTPDFTPERDALSQLHIFTKTEFLEMWKSLGLVRRKISRGTAKYYRDLYGPDYKTSIEEHADSVSVQSFSNSGKKSILVQKACEEKPYFIIDGVKTIKINLL